jgi:hypothetical protein
MPGRGRGGREGGREGGGVDEIGLRRREGGKEGGREGGKNTYVW